MHLLRLFESRAYARKVHEKIAKSGQHKEKTLVSILEYFREFVPATGKDEWRERYVFLSFTKWGVSVAVEKTWKGQTRKKCTRIVIGEREVLREKLRKTCDACFVFTNEDKIWGNSLSANRWWPRSLVIRNPSWVFRFIRLSPTLESGHSP